MHCSSATPYNPNADFTTIDYIRQLLNDYTRDVPFVVYVGDGILQLFIVGYYFSRSSPFGTFRDDNDGFRADIL